MRCRREMKLLSVLLLSLLVSVSARPSKENNNDLELKLVHVVSFLRWEKYI